MDTGETKQAKNTPAALSDIRIRNAKPKQKPYKLFDRGGLGLYVLITPRGSKLWQLKYRLNGREGLASLGKYPVISLSEARRRAVETRQLISQGVDPIEEKRALKAERYTFSQLAEEWISKTSNKWSGVHAIELQLVHKERGVRAVYHRAEYLDERRAMMQSWADYLDGLKQGGKVIPINRAGSDKNLT